jgi:tetratricopeptide (TPR) repeat protein
MREYEEEPLPGTLTLAIEGITYSQRIMPVDDKHPVAPTDRSDEALEVLMEALALEPYFASAIDLMLGIVGGGGELESSLLLAEALLAIDPHHQHAERARDVQEHAQASRVNRSLNSEPAPEIPEHIQALLKREEALYEPPVPPDAAVAESLFTASETYAARGDNARAERDLRRAIALNSSESKYVVALSDVLCADGRWADAETLLSSIVSNFSDDYRVYEAMGRVKNELKQYRESCIAFHKALACNPPEPIKWVITARLGSSYGWLGRLARGLEFLRDAYSHCPADSLVNVFVLQALKVEMLEAQDRADTVALREASREAEGVLNAAEQHGILGADLLFIKGQMMMIQRRDEEALQALRRALELDPGHPMVKKLIVAAEEGEFTRPQAHAASRS